MNGTTIPVPPPCQYCGELVGDNEWDSEPGAGGGYFSSHFRCMSPDPNGAFRVVSYLDHVPYGSPDARRYNNPRRAISEAISLARSNSRRWTFYVLEGDPQEDAETVHGVYEGRLRVTSVQAAGAEPSR